MVTAKKKSISDVLVFSLDDDISACLSVATYLRKFGINTEVYMDNKKVKAKMKYANKLNIPYVIIIGEEERKTGKYSLKNLSTGEQVALSLEEIAKIIA